MHIISGQYKGRVIKGFDIDGTRPTMERVKESLFAMIQNDIRENVVLDLFSGSGNLGIEALSEGASFAYFVDKNKIACKTILENLSKVGAKAYKVMNDDYKKALYDFKENNIKFDVIFLDPPYQANLMNEAIRLIEDYDLLHTGGILVCELTTGEIHCSYSLYKERTYGSKIVKIYKK